MRILLLYLGLLISLSQVCEAYKFLVMFPIPGKSHSILGDGVVRLLLDAGHEVTYVTSYPIKSTHTSLTQVDVSSGTSRFDPKESPVNINALLNKNVSMPDQMVFFYITQMITKDVFNADTFQTFIDDTKQHFDAIIIDWLFNELYSGLSAVFDCPYMWVSTIEPHWLIMRLIDESLNPAYNADNVSNNMVPFTFMQRVQELWSQIKFWAFKEIVISPGEQKQFEDMFSPIMAKRGKHLPSYEELKYNASLVIGNSHVSLGEAKRLPLNYIAVGGFHIDPVAKPLPEDLKKLMDDSKYGVIYFSMGSNLKSKDWPAVIKNGLISAFKELKQTIIWKFEENIDNLPHNVHIVQWAPQNSILAHPNCVLFITHGGLLSITETIHFGVPVIGIPVFGDQFFNINRAVRKGIGKKVDFSYTLAAEIKQAISEVLNTPSYRQRVKELSTIYHDRPVPPGVELVHWVEHVVRTRGALHLRSPALHVPFYQKMYLDLIALITAILLGINAAVTHLFSSKKKVKQQKKTN